MPFERVLENRMVEEGCRLRPEFRRVLRDSTPFLQRAVDLVHSRAIVDVPTQVAHVPFAGNCERRD